MVVAGESEGVRGFAFVGRERELGLLVGALSVRPAVVQVQGQAGIGKSRLVAEACAVLRAKGVRVITGGCHPLREPLAYGPVVDALRTVGGWLPEHGCLGASAGVLAGALPDLADRLPPPPVERLEPGALRHRTAQGVRDLLSAVAPVVLVVEDLHWADEWTRELLLLLARDLPADVGLVLTYRDEDLPEHRLPLGAALRRPPGTGGTELELGPLGLHALREMARSALGEGATPALTRALHERSAGLPLVAEEDLITLSTRDSAARLVQTLEVPRRLREVLAERTQRLSPGGRAVVDAAAVLVVPADEGLLSETAGLDEEAGEAALLEALAASVLYERSRDMYGFAHALARKAVYDAIPGPLRSRAHRRALEALRARSPQPLVQIAHHTRALGDTETWLVQVRAAADQAVALGDAGTAARLLGEVLDQPDLPAGLLGDTALMLGRLAWTRGEDTGAIPTLRRIVATPGLPVVVRGEIRLHLSTMLLNQEGLSAGLDELVKVLQEVEGHDPLLTARAMAMLAVPDTGRFPAAQQREWLERTLASLAENGDAITRGNAFSALALRGDPRFVGLLRELPRDGDPEVLIATANVLGNAATAEICVGLDRRAATHTEESVSVAGRSGHSMMDPSNVIRQLLLHWLAGRWDDWERGLEAARDRFPDNPLINTGLLATAQGITAAARGQASRAAHHFTLAIDQELDVFAFGTAAGTARLHLARSELEPAWDSLTPALSLLRRTEMWHFAWDLTPTAVEAALLRGDRAGAEELAAQHAVGIRGCEAPGAVAEQHLCRGVLLCEDDPGGAYDAFEQTRSAWADIGRPYHAALAAERAALVGTDPTTALMAPLAAFEHLGATADVARCHHHLRTRGWHPPHARGRAGYGTQLSPREAQVADLLAQRATNQDIATALSLSPRTVEHHVANVLRKRGTTRDQITEHHTT
ncbi:ATP-binding protein [Kitasatospora sp. NPDC057015]|uniref:ATP-binding protein n=1 Tax=Kitasatospora sp. NPDC057015 TaxID=3346001 RepID=UPI0036368C27